MAIITIVPLGDTLTELTIGAADILVSSGPVFMRTQHHPITAWLTERGVSFRSFDAMYDSAEDFDALRDGMAHALIAAAPCVYAAPDPSTDGCVKRLKELSAGITIIPGVTQASKALAVSASMDCDCTGARDGSALIVPASDIARLPLDPSRALVVTEIASPLTAGEVKLKLLTLYRADWRVTLGLRDTATVVPLVELDRGRTFDHTSWLLVPPAGLMERDRYDFADLLAVMDCLRDPDTGCPWDREQDHKTLREYIIEEACEVVDAIDRDDPAMLADELGDVLLQTVFHAKVAQQRASFDMLDITTAICAKMIRRHPHIFGAAVVSDSAHVLRNWEAIKRDEKQLNTATDVMKDIPRQLPSLMRASKIQKKARDAGFELDSPLESLDKAADALAVLRDELSQTGTKLTSAQQNRIEREAGDVLFQLVSAVRQSGVQPELAMTGASERYIARFTEAERLLAADGKAMKGLPLDDLAAYWRKAGSKEAGP